MGNEGSPPDERTRRRWEPWDGTKVVATPSGTRRVEPPAVPEPAPTPEPELRAAREPVRTREPEPEPVQRRRSRLVWWPLPAAIVLAALAAYLLTRPNDDAETTRATPTTTTAVAGTAHTKTAAAPAQPRTVGTLAAPAGALLPLPAGGELTEFVGTYVRARGVPVQSVVGNEAFWIGSSREQRVLVRVISGRGESAQRIVPGAKVAFAAAGVQRVKPSTAARLGITANEGARQLRRQGAYLSVLERKLRVSSP
jgi:hypothetical protein